MMPVLLNIVQELYDEIDRQQHQGETPLIVVPHPKGRLIHPGWRHLAAYAHHKMPKNPDEFETVINVQSFKPEEITVKVKGREILIEGKHEEREDQHGFIARQFTRRYILPDEFDIETVATYLDMEGKMTIKAQKPISTEDTKERIIPVERVATDAEPKAQEKKEEAEYKLEDVME